MKAMAIATQRFYASFRPSGVKVMAGAPVIGHGMEAGDFADLAAAGVTLLGEVGLGSVKDGPTARKMVDWARANGMQSTIHTGGPSIPGSGLIDADMVLDAGTDVVGHINGGHTALPDDQIRCICQGCKAALEIVHNGNERAALYTLRLAREMGQLERVIPGTDGPAGSGVQPPGHPAHGGDAVGAGRSACGTGVLPGDRQHRAATAAGCRAAGGGDGGGPEADGPRAARAGGGAAGVSGAGQPARHRHGADRRDHRLPPQPQHAPRDPHPPSGDRRGPTPQRQPPGRGIEPRPAALPWIYGAVTVNRVAASAT